MPGPMKLTELPFKLLSHLPDPRGIPLVLLRSAITARAVKNAVKKEGKGSIKQQWRTLQEQAQWVDDSQVCGIQVGEVSGDSAIVWLRCPWPANVRVHWRTATDHKNDAGEVEQCSWQGADVHTVQAPAALAHSDLTSRVTLHGLPRGEHVAVRVVASPLQDQGGPWVRDTCFRCAPDDARPIKFAWSADVGGQGFGIRRDATGSSGMPVFDVLRGRGLDFFVHVGDTIYADHPLSCTVKDERGRDWHNITTQARSKVAETVDDFRGNYRYNWLDAGFARFCSEVPQLAIWDDHEVVNNWSPSLSLARDKRYQNKDLCLLAAHASQAFREYMPMPLDGFDGAGRLYRRVSYGPLLDVFLIDMHSHRGPNDHNLQETPDGMTCLFGSAQLAWLKQALLESTATWKVLAAGMPLGLNVPDGLDSEGRVKWQGIANGDDGAPKGRELELADLLSFVKRHHLHNLVWLCGDVHYPAAHHYDPAQAHHKDFLPFWEFVAGPLHAGSYGPLNPDGTFGLQVRYARTSPLRGASPAAGFQSFGEVTIDAQSKVMTVTLFNGEGHALHTERLTPH